MKNIIKRKEYLDSIGCDYDEQGNPINYRQDFQPPVNLFPEFYTQHTPGPWRVYEKPEYPEWDKNCSHELVPSFVVELGKRRIEIGFTAKQYIGDIASNEQKRIAEANARLIASAPELLKERDELKKKLKAQEEHGNIIWLDREKIILENAKLKALNAELLEALKSIQDVLANDVLDELKDISEYSHDALLTELTTINKAIAKAEGK